MVRTMTYEVRVVRGRQERGQGWGVAEAAG
jgi:hypothetical protein